VIAPPDRKQGRGRKLASPPVADVARELGIELLQTGDANEDSTLGAVRAAEPEAIGICAFGQLIREPLLSLRPMFNVHTSLLPRWRGAAPIERALMAGDSETGVTIFELEAGLDTGPVALEQSEPIQRSDTYGTLAPRLAAIGGRLLVETFDRLEAGTLELTAQPDVGVTYAEKIDPAERRLDPARPAAELVNVVRAFTPHIGAFVELEGGDRLGLTEVAVADVQAPAGELLADGDRLLLGTSDGTLELLEVKPAGKQAMLASAYLRGRQQPPALAS
jgi:methionyl-tRNA formyltransferase